MSSITTCRPTPTAIGGAIDREAARPPSPRVAAGGRARVIVRAIAKPEHRPDDAGAQRQHDAGGDRQRQAAAPRPRRQQAARRPRLGQQIGVAPASREARLSTQQRDRRERPCCEQCEQPAARTSSRAAGSRRAAAGAAPPRRRPRCQGRPEPSTCASPRRERSESTDALVGQQRQRRGIARREQGRHLVLADEEDERRQHRRRRAAPQQRPGDPPERLARRGPERARGLFQLRRFA